MTDTKNAVAQDMSSEAQDRAPQRRGSSRKVARKSAEPDTRTREQKKADYKKRKSARQETKHRLRQERYRQKNGIQSKNDPKQRVSGRMPAQVPDSMESGFGTDVDEQQQTNQSLDFMSVEASSEAATDFNEMIVNNMERMTNGLVNLMFRLRLVENHLDRAEL